MTRSNTIFLLNLVALVTLVAITLVCLSNLQVIEVESKGGVVESKIEYSTECHWEVCRNHISQHFTEKSKYFSSPNVPKDIPASKKVDYKLGFEHGWENRAGNHLFEVCDQHQTVSRIYIPKLRGFSYVSKEFLTGRDAGWEKAGSDVEAFYKQLSSRSWPN